MLRRQMTKIIWSILLISILLTRNSLCSPTTKLVAKNATKAATTKSSTTLLTTSKPITRTTASPSSTTRSGTQVKKTTKRTTTAKPILAATTANPVLKNASTSTTKQNNKKRTSTTTTTASPIDMMNKIYQIHGMASSGSSYSRPSSSYSSHSSSYSSMDDIYKQHALALAHASSGSSYQKKPDHSSYNDHHYSSSDSSTTKKPSVPYKTNMEQIYQQHSSLPSAMHHIMAQHSVQSSSSSASSSSASSSSSSSSSSRPQKTKTKTKQPSDASSTALSMFMQPLLKQLTPVGAGLSVVLAPFLLFNGFLTFFSNISRFLNNFAQTMLPVRRPPNSNQGQNQNFPQNIAHLRRQPRDWFESLEYLEDLDDLTEQILKAIQAGGH